MDETKIAAAVTDLLYALGADQDPHTVGTPGRVARYWLEALDGYTGDPADHLERAFPGPPDPGLVIVAGNDVRSTCAHHLLPITGTATVAYRPRPGQGIVGLSKLTRLLHGYARRLQVQEQIGHQVVTALMSRLDPVGAACLITAEHGCMTMRGVMQPGTVTTTQALAGDWSRAADGAAPCHHPDVQAVLAEHARRS